MIFYFAAIFESGRIIEQERFDSATFDRNAVESYRKQIDKGEDFGEDLKDVHFEYTRTGPRSAIIEISSENADVSVYLLRNTDPDFAKKELDDVFTAIHDTEETVGEVLQIKTRPLALAVLPDATPEVRTLSRYSIALAAAFFETIAT